MSRVFYLPSFIKQLQKLRGGEAQEAEAALVAFQHFVKGPRFARPPARGMEPRAGTAPVPPGKPGAPSAVETGEKAAGLGFKKLADDKFEIRVDIRKRIVMKKMGEDYFLALYGDHDAIERFLRRQ